MRPCRMPAVLMWMALLGSAADVASAQEQRVAVFGDIAAVDAHGPERGYGTMAMHGAELVVHVRGTVYAGFDVQAGRIGGIDIRQASNPQAPFFETVATPFEFLQTSVTASVFREWPSTSRIKGLAGGGAGWLSEHGRHEWGDYEYKTLVLHARGGVVWTVSKHLRIRAEGVSSFPAFLGARVGIGYVF